MNNMFSFEFKRNLKSFIIWQIPVAFFLIVYASFYPAFKDSATDLTTLFDGAPDAFLEIFKITPESFTSYVGFYSFTLVFVNLIISIAFVYIAHNLFNKEYSKKINEYILTKPMSRSKVFVSKCFVGLVFILLFILIYTVFSFVSASLFGDDNTDFGLLSQINVYVYLTTFVFYAIAVFISSLNIKIKFSTMLSLPLVFGMYILNFVANILEKDFINYVTPFGFLDSSKVIENGIDSGDVIYSLVYGLVFIILGYIVYTRKESK